MKKSQKAKSKPLSPSMAIGMPLKLHCLASLKKWMHLKYPIVRTHNNLIFKKCIEGIAKNVLGLC